MSLFSFKSFSFSLLFSLVFIQSISASLTQDTIYLTWQQNPSTTMTVQWISSFQEKQSTVIYHQRKENFEWKQVVGETLPFPQTSQYLIHRVELQDLQPNSEYIFKILPYGDEYRFITAPAQLSNELRFIVGGDMYHDDIKWMAKTCQTAAQTNPLFAVIGGDIAYAVKSRHLNFQSIEQWIEWVRNWHATMITPHGNLIPVISAMGNHDVIGQYNQSPQQAAVFSALFPMPGNQIYNVLDFNSYLTIFLLDSGHATPIGGQQTNWLSKNLETRRDILHRFAVYHVPAYPAIRTFQNKLSFAIRHYWVPLFEKNGIQAVFEHHDHAYKRTYPLIKSRVQSKGITYIGDGGWGVEKPRKAYAKRHYIAKLAPVRHFISVTISPTSQKFQCITDEGQTIDEFQQTL